MKKVIPILLTLLAFGLVQCRKSRPPRAVLPPATQEGKNTVGFALDGEVWVPYGRCGFGSDPCREISARYGLPFAAPNGIDFQFTRKKGEKSSSLTISSTLTGTITAVGDKIDSITVIYRPEEWGYGNVGIFVGPLPNSKFVITKIDPQQQIISGEFELVLLEQNGSGNTITLKDGRFDFRFNACRCSN